MELHILGTSSARPTGKRQVSGSLIQCDEGIVVVDAGEGFQTRYAEQRKRLKVFEKGTTLRASKIGAVCLTHGHLDHTWGLLPWMHTMALDNREAPLLVLGPTSSEVFEALLSGKEIPESAPSAELARQIRAWQALGATSKELGYQVQWVLGDVISNRWLDLSVPGQYVELETMPQPSDWKKNRLLPLGTQHTVPSCAWMVESKGKSGKFDRLRAAELRLSDSQKAQLSLGEDVHLNDGSVLNATEFRGKVQPAMRVVISGDTAEMTEEMSSLSYVDVLVHEATFLDEAQEWADKFLHSTSTGAARTAQACNAKHLVLTHFSARLKDANIPLSDAKKVLSGTQTAVTSAHDGDRIQLTQSGVTHLVWGEEGWSG